jgi:hypothetical protein
VNELSWDTTSESSELFHRMLMARSGEDRVKMACDMFDTAKALIIASLPPEVAADPAERSIAVLYRLYERDLAPAFLTRIAADLRRRLGTAATTPAVTPE